VWLASHRLRGAPILVADDPAADLGPGDLKVAVRLLREARTAGSCVVISTRSTEFAAAAADDVLTIVNGHVEPR
jgi:ABC-type ATPase involved in cell division